MADVNKLIIALGVFVFLLSLCGASLYTLYDIDEGSNYSVDCDVTGCDFESPIDSFQSQFNLDDFSLLVISYVVAGIGFIGLIIVIFLLIKVLPGG